MGFNKRIVKLKYCIEALENNNLRGYYGKSDALFFEEILINIKKHMEEQSYEMY
jgi:hypothetical protein